MNTIKVEFKPTKHEQYCQECKQRIEKGARRVAVVCGETSKYYEWHYYHLDCFFRTLNKECQRVGVGVKHFKLSPSYSEQR